MSSHKSLKNPTNRPLVIKVKANTSGSSVLQNPGHSSVFSMPVIIRHKALSKVSPKRPSNASRTMGGRNRKTTRKHGKKVSKVHRRTKTSKKRTTLKRSKKHKK
jgi:hypothetical protein